MAASQQNKMSVDEVLRSLNKNSQQPGSPTGDPAALTTYTALETVLQREVQLLQDPQSAVRRRSLLKIQVLVEGQAPPYLVCQAAQQLLAKPVLCCFADPAETCREQAVHVVLGLIKREPQCAVCLLPYLMPVVEERLHSDGQTFCEPSEDLRLLLIDLLGKVIAQANHAIASYVAPVATILQAACRDSFPEVSLAACRCMQALAAGLGLRLGQVSKQLTASFIPLLTARHYKVRVEAIRTVKALVQCGAHEMILELTAFQDPNSIAIRAFYEADVKTNYFGKLATDSSAVVRREFLALLGDWLLSLRERADHETRLLPYVLGALADPAPQVAAEGLALLERLGHQWEEEHRADLEDKTAYLPSEAHTLGWQPEGLTHRLYSCAVAKGRPGRGARRLVQASFGGVAGVLAREMQDWRSEVQLKAILLLRSCLVFVEDYASAYLHTLLPALRQRILQEDVREGVRECCHVLGCFVMPGLYLDLLQLSGAASLVSAERLTGGLAVLAALLHGAGHRCDLAPHFDRILLSLEDEHLLTSTDTSLKHSAIAAVDALLLADRPSSAASATRLARVLLWLAGDLSTAAPCRRMAEAVLDKLAAACGHASQEGLLAGLGRRQQLLSLLEPRPAFADLTLLVYARALLPPQVVHHIVREAQHRSGLPQDDRLSGASPIPDDDQAHGHDCWSDWQNAAVAMCQLYGCKRAKPYGSGPAFKRHVR
ncbi:hypothetical protein WJX72_005730 [[Myrmecia] bisecta]|uniref:Uncharacterized protein n=1 Tax=[Myrmecia] bisecta TaxID=41462 RepID=A0AAW1PSF3_9CHLO